MARSRVRSHAPHRGKPRVRKMKKGSLPSRIRKAKEWNKDTPKKATPEQLPAEDAGSNE